MTSLTDRERFLTWMRVEQGRSDRTIEAYGRDIAQYESYLVSAKSTSRVVKPAQIEKYVGQLRANERAPKSIARQFAAIRMFHRFMLDEGLRTDNPTAFIDGVKVPSGIPKALSEQEVELLLNAVTGVDSLAVRDRALLEFLYATGARVSEACGLSMSDVDMESNVARVFGKGSKERIVPFGRHAKEALEVWLGAGGRPMLCPQQWANVITLTPCFLVCAVHVCHGKPHGALCANMRCWPVLRASFHLMCFDIRAPLTCWCTEPICESCKSCLGMHQ